MLKPLWGERLKDRQDAEAAIHAMLVSHLQMIIHECQDQKLPAWITISLKSRLLKSPEGEKIEISSDCGPIDI